MKQGILLLNFGGPLTLADVKPFLYRLFASPRVLVGVPAPLRQVLAFMIAQIKGPSSIKNYRAIGGGSPQLKWTVIQAEGLRQLLPRNEVQVEFGMRSSEPSIQTALEQMKFWGADELVLMPLFPQFSTTTTGTCFDVVEEGLNKLKWHPHVRSSVIPTGMGLDNECIRGQNRGCEEEACRHQGSGNHIHHKHPDTPPLRISQSNRYAG
jgi:ferrochelatase